MSRESRESKVAACAIEIRSFCPSDPMLWFTQVEAQFLLRGITAHVTKFHHVLANLSQENATEVRDLLMNPPAENPHDVLKETLIQRTTLSKQQRLQQCLALRILEIGSLLICSEMQQLLNERADAMDLSFFITKEFCVTR